MVGCLPVCCPLPPSWAKALRWSSCRALGRMGHGHIQFHESAFQACQPVFMRLQVAAAYGCRCFIAMPDDAAVEKAEILRALGEGDEGGLQKQSLIAGVLRRLPEGHPSVWPLVRRVFVTIHHGMAQHQ